MLDKMDETMSTPREGIKEHGPVYSKPYSSTDVDCLNIYNVRCTV